MFQGISIYHHINLVKKKKLNIKNGFSFTSLLTDIVSRHVLTSVCPMVNSDVHICQVTWEVLIVCVYGNCVTPMYLHTLNCEVVTQKTKRFFYSIFLYLCV